MAASGDVTIAQDGEPNVKLHPYLVALVRWCVSCVWGTATVLLHRIIAGYPIPSITATARPLPKSRAASKDHLHPEPKVECQVLHTPPRHSVDVIFVHGLYGSLGNTWRQGEWRAKYHSEPSKMPLLRPSTCNCNAGINVNKCKPYGLNEVSYKDIEEKFYRKITDDEAFITEKFYNNTFLDQVEIVDNYESQAQFVRDLFEKETEVCDSGCDSKCKGAGINEVSCECKVNEVRKCEVGCGCVCDECYSTCWPRDWIKEDYPDARVISINYTSDPYLWRPLWIKECKRLRLHERADQMTEQLLQLGVGERPIIWVGHSKGGLFIKQIYCDAYEAYLKTQKQNTNTYVNKYNEKNDTTKSNIENNNDKYDSGFENDINKSKQFDFRENELNEVFENDCEIEVSHKINESSIINEVNGNLSDKLDFNGVKDIMCIENETRTNGRGTKEMEDTVMTSNSEEDLNFMSRRASLWRNSAGFMFYSVPHRGSPLAAIKTPITARSVELLEISKDCTLVLSLQDRWLRATEQSRVQVRSLVETCRTLMSVLWLRIVSVNSADAGIGSLYGVPVDHREICKPSSRRCLLYQELVTLMRAALNRCSCTQ